MQTIRKINDELSIAGQISLEQLPQLAQEGYRSILNLRSPNEKGFLPDEAIKTDHWGLSYLNMPIQLGDLDYESVLNIIEQISRLPKPVLIHCESAERAAAMMLIYVTTQHGATLEQALQRAENLGLFLSPITYHSSMQ